jgi:hypothetical protein
MRTWAESKYKRPRRRTNTTAGRANRKEKIEAATKLLLHGRTILRRGAGGMLFANAASYAQ